MDKLRKLLLPVLAAIFLVGNFSPFLLTASAWDVPTWDVPKWDIPKWDAPAWDLDKEQEKNKEVPEDWKEEHEEEFSEDGEKQDYTDMSLWEFLASGEYKEYIKRLKSGLAQLPADMYDYIDSGDAGKEIQQWWKETTDYISNGGLLKDLQSAAKSLVSWESLKAFGAGLLTKEFYTGFANDMTVGMLADIEAFATGTDPKTGKKINLPNRIDSLVQSFVKPAKIVKKVKAFDKIIDKLSIKKLDGKDSGKGKDSSATNGDKDQKAGGNHVDDGKGKDSSERKKESPVLDAPAAGDNVGNQLRNGKDGKDSGKDSSGGKNDGDKGIDKAKLGPSNYPNPDPPLSMPPVRYEPQTIEEVMRMRQGKGPTTKKTHGDKNIEAHHRQQVPVKNGGILDELEQRTHRGEGNHTRHDKPSQLTPSQRAKEIREHYKERGKEYLLPGEGVGSN